MFGTSVATESDAVAEDRFSTGTSSGWAKTSEEEAMVAAPRIVADRATIFLEITSIISYCVI